jgi:hypothetical protein
MRGDLQDGRHQATRTTGARILEVLPSQAMELLAPVMGAEAHREGLVDPVQREPAAASRIPPVEEGARLAAGGGPAENGGVRVHASPPEGANGTAGIHAERRRAEHIGTSAELA